MKEVWKEIFIGMDSLILKCVTGLTILLSLIILTLFYVFS